MKAFSLLKITAIAIAAFLASSAMAQRVVVYYPGVIYAAPVTYQVYTACPCSGTWGSPSCNCPDTVVQTTSCSSCGVEQEYHMVPGHWHGDEYEVYYDVANVYPTPYSYNENMGYTLDP